MGARNSEAGLSGKLHVSIHDVSVAKQKHWTPSKE